MTGHTPEIESRCIGNDTCLAEPVDASAASSQTSSEVFSSAIEFYVRSDEGINLYVDLNSCPSYWTERLKNEVYICKSIHRERCQNLQQNLFWLKGHKEITSSFQWNNHGGQINVDCVHQNKSPSSSNLMTTNCTEGDQPDEADGSVISSAMMSHIINADVSEHLNEDQTLMSSETDFDVQNPKLSGFEFCATEDKCTMILDLDINGTFQKMAYCDSISGDPTSPVTLEPQNSVLESEICENSTLPNSCSILNISVGYLGSSAGGSMSDIEQCPRDVSSSSYGAVSQRGLKNISDYSLPTVAGKWERSNIGIAVESSDGSHFPDSDCDSLRKMFIVSHNLESNGAHKRKRKLVKDETKCHYGEPHRRVLRSRKHNVKEVLPRRSRRLVSRA